MTEFRSPEVEVSLGEETHVLKCTPGAGLRISRHFGGLLPASQRVMSFDIDAIAAVIRFGAGIPDKDAKDLTEKVEASFSADLAAAVTTYLGYWLNGGRAEKPSGEA